MGTPRVCQESDWNISMLQASILVVSRTPELANRLIDSLNEAYSGADDSIEVLLSWNGTQDDEAMIKAGRFGQQIAQRDPYHFASNMNNLAKKAKGEFLVFANDDLIADPGAIDAAIERLKSREDVGIVGAQLRTSTGSLAHAGIHFTAYGSPYHQLEHFAPCDHAASSRERLVPAVTGAFFAMRRLEFLQIELTESFNVCGEDVLLSLQTREKLNKQVLYCPAMSGIHDAESTRSKFEQQQENADDMKRMRTSWLEMIQRADKADVLIELNAAQVEAEDLRGLCSEAIASCHKLALEIESQTLHQAHLTKEHLESSLLQAENRRLRARVQQLENLAREQRSPDRA